MQIIFHFFSFLSLIKIISATYSGPFVFWGLEKLKGFEVSALRRLDDSVLRDLYSEANSVILFIRNGSTRMTEENYPSFKEVIQKKQWIYLPQNWLLSDPVDYNVNAEIINLVGPTSQQDVEISGLFHEAQLNYGEGKVLGILATRHDDHQIRKRQSIDETIPGASPMSPLASPSPTDEPTIEDYIYYKDGKACMYATSPPIVRIYENNATDDDSATMYELKSHNDVQVDYRDKDQLIRIIIIFAATNQNNIGQKLTLRFRFPLSNGYWYLNSVEFEGLNQTLTNLTVVGDPPSAPMTFSWKCSRSLVFRNDNISLTMENVQVQPSLNGSTNFSDAYDCVGFMTAPIWSGLAVTFLLLFVVSIAIAAILDMKPPNRFESTRSKQLTFTVQE